MNGVLWTVAEAGTQAVTQIVGHEFGFAVDDLNGTFRTGRHAKTASVAFFLIDMNDIPFHACSPAAEGWRCLFVRSMVLSSHSPSASPLTVVKKISFW
jgi:hypothetical protein